MFKSQFSCSNTCPNSNTSALRIVWQIKNISFIVIILLFFISIIILFINAYSIVHFYFKYHHLKDNEHME